MVKKSPIRSKHIPQRTCVGCHQVLPKRTLTRIVRTATGLQIDNTGKLPGRGAYIHDQKPCWQSAIKGKLATALRTELTEQDRELLQNYMENIPVSTPNEDQTVNR
ncbi:MAG: YlxR family protein [Anaerolineaceae bacterium]